MSWVDAVSWLTISSLGAGLATLVLIELVYNYRGKPGANWLLVLSTVSTGFCLSYGHSLVVFDPQVRVWFESLTWIGMARTGPLFLAFALEYTGRGNIVGRPPRSRCHSSGSRSSHWTTPRAESQRCGSSDGS